MPPKAIHFVKNITRFRIAKKQLQLCHCEEGKRGAPDVGPKGIPLGAISDIDGSGASGGYLSCSGKKDTKEAGQRGSLDLPIETPFPFGIPQALLLQHAECFGAVILLLRASFGVLFSYLFCLGTGIKEFLALGENP